MTLQFARLLVRALMLAAVLCALGGAARAHASFVRSEPADGSILYEAPEFLRLVFSEPVAPLVLNLVGPGGDPVRLDRHRLQGSTLVIAPPGGLPDGSYALSWRVTSTDGHPIGGSIVFSVGAASARAPVMRAAESAGLKPCIWVVKLTLYLGLFLGVGALPFHAFIAPAPPPARRISLVLIGVGLMSIPPSAGLHGLDLLGAPPGRIWDAEIWSAALSSGYARTLSMAAGALAIGLAAWPVRVRWLTRVLSVAALAGVGGALAASGHASAANPQWLTRPAVFLHGATIAAWAGSLLPFALAIRGGGASASGMLRRFAAAILPVVALLVLAGAALAVVQVGRVEALWTTAYGRVLVAKLVLLLFLFTLAAINRFSLTPAYASGDPAAARRFVRSAQTEIVLVCAILAVASLWRFTPPPRSLAAAEAAPVSLHIHAGKAMAELTIAPGKAGPVSATVQVMTGEFEPLEPQEVTLSLANPSAGIEPIRRPMAKDAEGRWSAGPLVLPVAGVWVAGIDLLISDFEIVTLRGEVSIGR